MGRTLTPSMLRGFAMGKHLQALAVVAGSLVASGAYAAAQVYTGLTTSVTDEIAAAMPIVLAVGGTLLGIGVAFRLIRRAGKF